MNLASVLLKKIISDNDLDTWSVCHKHYLPDEYHKIYNFIATHLDNYHELPSFDDLKYSAREAKLRDSIYALEKSEETDIDCDQLLDYLKNEFTQIEIMEHLDRYLESTIALSSAEENIEALQNIIVNVEERVDLKPPEEDMSKIELFESEDDLARSLALGLNKDFDNIINFAPTDYVLFGGKRGHGKSVTCANIAANTFNKGGSVIYFTIEMTARRTLQRIAAISSDVPMGAIKNKNLSWEEWDRVAKWWSSRFEDGEQILHDNIKEHDFEKLHSELIKRPLRSKQMDVVYDPSLTLGKIRAELDKKVELLQPKVVIIDYLNQVKRSNVVNSKSGQYDWIEQIEISKALKNMAQEYEITFISPYQIDASGEARFSKGILDAPDAAFTLNAHSKEDNIISFDCTKMRDDVDAEEASFTSKINWPTLTIGPDSGIIPGAEEGEEPIEDIK